MMRAPETGEVSAAVRAWLAGQGYGAVTDATPPERLSGGADFWVYGLRFAGPGLPPRWSAPLVARVPAAAGRYDMLRQDSAVQSWAAAQGYPAPEVLTVLVADEALPSPVQVMARAPGVPLIAAARGRRFPELLVQMGAAHAELHRLGSPPADARPGQVPGNWLRLAQHLAQSGGRGQLAASLRKIELVQDRLEVADPVVCHGDFHPLNVLTAPGGPALYVIDWTNVGIGDRHGDIAWTLLWFEIAAVAAPRRVHRVLMRVLRRRLQRAYLTGYQRVLPVDRERVRLWRPVSLLRIWSAAEASQRGFFGPEPRLPATLIGWATREFHRALESRQPGRSAMAEATPFTIGADASCSDGICGQVSRVVVDPVARTITHLVVKPAHGHGLGRLVPLSLVDASAGQIRLRCTRAEFEKLERGEEKHFLSSSNPYPGYHADQVLEMAHFGLRSYLGQPGESVTYDSVPRGEVAVRRGDLVFATDGDIGQVQGLVIDPASHQVTHVLLEEGHLWGRKEVAIPIGAVTALDDGIRLSMTKQQVQDLPPVDIDHPGLGQ